MADRQHSFLLRRDLACDQLLQSEVNVHAGIDRIDPQIRHRPVAAFAGQRETETVNRRKDIAAIRHCPERERRTHMHRESGVHMRILKKPVFDQRHRARKLLLARLEHQLYRALQFPFVSF